MGDLPFQFPHLPEPVITGLSDIEDDSFLSFDINPLRSPQPLSPLLGAPRLGPPFAPNPQVLDTAPLTAQQEDVVNTANGGVVPRHSSNLKEQPNAEDQNSAPNDMEALLQQGAPSEFFDNVDAAQHSSSLGEDMEQDAQVGEAEYIVASQPPHDSKYSSMCREESQLGAFFFRTYAVRNPPECNKCPKSKLFPSPEHLRQHSLAKHGKKRPKRKYTKKDKGPKKRNICDVCRHEFKNRPNLKRHRNLVHTMDTYNCDKCPANFSSRTCYVAHMRSEHNVTPASVLKRFGPDAYKKRALKKKSGAYRNTGWVVHVCCTCSFFSDSKGNMRRHINGVHRKIAPFKCPVNDCPLGFKTKNNLQQHLGSKHPGTPQNL